MVKVMEKHIKIANLFLATLRSIDWIHRHSHWTTKGNSFYGDHLLFQRLYEAAQESADATAEKFIGIFGEQAVDCATQQQLMAEVLKKYSGKDSAIDMSISIEKDFVKLAQTVYDIFKNEDVMTLGLDDTIMSIANKHEEAVYLLQQTKNETKRNSTDE
jgi:DNA-binding ferritin-like protein